MLTRRHSTSVIISDSDYINEYLLKDDTLDHLTPLQLRTFRAVESHDCWSPEIERKILFLVRLTAIK